MTDEEVVDAEVVEESDNLPAVQSQAVNLFGDASPVEVVERATAAADALAAVVEKKHLFAMISGKKHVTVEGWTLLGSMLGVFPVVEWTRETDDGWEARVVARTRNGDEVGAAEAMCSRLEGRWKTADSYAIRSMAQTRAVSKALRHPLGFVMTLAGYEATPEAEMPRETAEVIVRENDPLPAPRSWAKITEYVSAYDEGTHDVFFQFVDAAMRRLFGKETTKELSKEEKDGLFQYASRAALSLRNNVDASTFPPPTLEDIRTAWAEVMDGEELAIPREEEGYE